MMHGLANSPCYQRTDFLYGILLPSLNTKFAQMQLCSAEIQEIRLLKGFHEIKLQSQGRELIIKVL